MHRKSNFGLIIVGDAMLNVVAELATEAADLDYAEASISFHAGGSGLNLALAAAAAGFTPVSLICSLGADRFANSIIRAELKDAGIGLIVNPVEEQQTGVAVIAYIGGGERIMLAASGANGTPLTADTIDALPESGFDAVVISGYMLFRPSSRHSVVTVMRQAKQNGMAVVVDLVPHSIHSAMESTEFQELLDLIDFVAAEKNTLAALGATIDQLLADVEGILEYEVGVNYRAVNRAGLQAEGKFPHPLRSSALRGMTDRLLMSVLREHFFTT